jgi:hypothetical protein
MLANPSENGDSFAPRKGEKWAAYMERTAPLRALHAKAPPPAPKPTPFPVLWAVGSLPAPNIILRSALFRVTKRGRTVVADEIIACQKIDGYAVVFSGARLDQFDCDVWLTIVALSRDFGLGVSVPITLRGIAGRVGIGSSGEDVERIRKSLDRLYKCEVRLDAGRRRWYRGHMISGFGRVDDRYEITLDDKLVELFVPDQFTLLMGAERLTLDSSLAKWLHGFLATQTAPERFPHKVSTLRELCGSESKDLFHFRAKLRAALADLEGRGIISAWSIDKDDLVRITRNLTDSQKRALKKSDARENRARLAALQNAQGPRGGRGGGLQRLL